MMAKRKELKELTLKEKVDLLRFLESSSQRKTAEHFGVSKTTVSNIQKRKDEYLERNDKESGGLPRKRRKSPLDEVNEATLHWFKQMRAVNARISGPMIREIAKEFAKEFGKSDFQASSGWLEKFKLRHGISPKVMCGESNEVPVEVVEKSNENFPDFTSGYAVDDIFNAKKCRLFFKALPDRSLVMKSDKCKSGELSKEYFTVLLCTSLTGEKLKPLVIGKSAKPRSFKNLHQEDLPIIWKSNKSAWMTSTLLEEWIRDIDQEMKLKKRSVLLVIDNCPSHSKVNHLTNVKLEFLPPNTASELQPLTQGIIKKFKMHYRAYLLNWVIAKTQTYDSFAEASSSTASITALDAVLWISSAWNRVQPETIQKTAEFVTTQEQDVETLLDSPPPMVESEGEDLEDFAAMDDDDVEICVEPDPEAILQSALTKVQPSRKVLEGTDETDELSEEDIEIIDIPEEEDVNHLIMQLKSFAIEKCPDMLSGVASIESAFSVYLDKKNDKQTKIDFLWKECSKHEKTIHT